MGHTGSGVRVSASFQILALRMLLHGAGVTFGGIFCLGGKLRGGDVCSGYRIVHGSIQTWTNNIQLVNITKLFRIISSPYRRIVESNTMAQLYWSLAATYCITIPAFGRVMLVFASFPACTV